MRCSGSPTTSCAATAEAAAPGRDEAALHEAAAQFEALLLKDVLAPLGKALGPVVGDLATESFARAIARSDADGLAAVFRRALAPRDAAPPAEKTP